jgi:hypothetical protein
VILGDALLAAAEHIGVLILDAGLDLDRGLLLGGRYPRNRRASVAYDDNLAELKARKLHYVVASRQLSREGWRRTGAKPSMRMVRET